MLPKLKAIDLDPVQTADIMLHIAPHSVETIRNMADAEFLASVALGMDFGTTSFAHKQCARRLWNRARAARAGLVAVAFALGLVNPADAMRSHSVHLAP